MSEIGGSFFSAIEVGNSRAALARLAKGTGISTAQLRSYEDNHVLPSGKELESLVNFLGIPESVLKLRMGIFDEKLISQLSAHDNVIEKLLQTADKKEPEAPRLAAPSFKTRLGKLWQMDCVKFLSACPSDSVDLFFADPPFNLSKMYPSKISDDLKRRQYITWCQEWLGEAIRILKPGGSLFLWNLPSWNLVLGEYLNSRLFFKHWITVDIKYSLPIAGRLYPSHYALLYFVKGNKASSFSPDRLATPTCPKCFGDLKDYGGYKHKMNPAGVSLTDVWTDIPPVRHAKYKRREGANELSIKLMDRIIEMSTSKGDIVCDPFGGSGTTYMTAELKGRKWIGCELGPLDDIISRFSLIDEERTLLKKYRDGLNQLFPENVKKRREEKGLWTAESVSNR